jgi:serine/threonine protein kinase
MIGKGAFGSVFIFNEKENPERKVACKIIRKYKLDDLKMEIMRDEISIMAQFDHPNVIKYIESYEDSRYIFMIMELMPDAVELADLMKNKK